MTYELEQEKSKSGKILLAHVNSSKRLMGWSLNSGSIYKIESQDFSFIVSLLEDGTAMTEVSDLASVVVNTFFNDRVNKTIFAHVTGGVNPNGLFLALTFRNFYSNVPINLAHDLASGFEVHYLPLIKSVSSFGVELDNNDQIGLAIEGNGSLDFYNDFEYWSPIYDKLFWDNQDVKVYSFFDGLDASEAKIIYNGRIDSKTWSSSSVSFRLKDLLNELRAEFPLTDLEALTSDRIRNDLLMAKQRQIYGRVFGHVATPVDTILDGFPLTATVTATSSSTAITGAGTAFLNELAPEDKIIIDDGEEFTIESVASDTALILTEPYSGSVGTGLSFVIIPNRAKNFINRKFKISGHALKEPATTVVTGFSLSRFEVGSVENLLEGDAIFLGALGSGERNFIERIDGNIITTTQNFLLSPSPGTAFIRPSAINVRINNTLLLFDRDYSVDSALGTLTLKSIAEENTAPVRTLNGSITFTSGLRAVTGSGTSFESQLFPGYVIRAKGNVNFFRILSIESDTALTLTEVSNYTDTDDPQYKPIENFDDTIDTLSCDVMGATEDGLKTGVFIETGSDMVKDILIKTGLTSFINSPSFAKSKILGPQKIGLVIPLKFTDTDIDPARDYINDINQTLLSSLVQNEDFEFEYNILNPAQPPSPRQFTELDVIRMSVETDSERIVKTSIVRYLNKEHDPEAGEASFKSSQKTSNIANFLVKTNKTRTIKTLFQFQTDARIYASRWSFILEIGSTVVKLRTKMQGARLQVNDVIDILHQKIYERIGGGNRKLTAVQSVKKNHKDVSIETEDLSNAFNRVGVITQNDAFNFNNATEDAKFFDSYITDNFGLINNDSETHGLNVIW